MTTQITVVIADDHTAIRRALRTYLENEVPNIEVLDEVERGADLEAMVQKYQPDLLILDLEMEAGFDPPKVISRLRETHPCLRVLIYSAHEEPEVVRSLMDTGADGYVHKRDSMDDLVRATRQIVIDERPWVSSRLSAALLEDFWRSEVRLEDYEKTILEVFRHGGTMEDAARQVSVSSRTVSGYIAQIKQKLDADTITEAVANAIQLGIIEIE
jgi:DNA-binding NarL/FixJ family response regulator